MFIDVLIRKSVKLGYPGSCLDNELFYNFFTELVRLNKISEYYLLDFEGSFLMIDQDRNSTVLIVRHDKDFDYYIQMMEGLDADEAVISKLKNREKLPFFILMTNLSYQSKSGIAIYLERRPS